MIRKKKEVEHTPFQDVPMSVADDDRYALQECDGGKEKYCEYIYDFEYDYAHPPLVCNYCGNPPVRARKKKLN